MIAESVHRDDYNSSPSSYKIYGLETAMLQSSETPAADVPAADVHAPLYNIFHVVDQCQRE